MVPVDESILTAATNHYVHTYVNVYFFAITIDKPCLKNILFFSHIALINICCRYLLKHLTEVLPMSTLDTCASAQQNYKMACAPAKTQISLGICHLIRVFSVHMKKAWVLCYPLSTQQRPISRCQADLSLHWAHMPFCWFCHAWLI